MAEIKIVYVELPSADVAASKKFYGSLCGWGFEDYGPEYASFSGAGVEGGFNGAQEQRTKAPLIVLLTDDLEAVFARVQEMGAAISCPIFSFPGGRRFHFLDPSGNEVAMMQAE